MTSKQLLEQIYLTGSKRKIDPAAARANAESIENGHVFLVRQCELTPSGIRMMKQLKAQLRGRVACNWGDFHRENGGGQVRPPVPALRPRVIPPRQAFDEPAMVM